MLPLDLHVLSLSLAFILSQDQTLRCIYIVLSFSLEKTHDLLSKTTNLVEPVPHTVDVLRTIFIGEPWGARAHPLLFSPVLSES